MRKSIPIFIVAVLLAAAAIFILTRPKVDYEICTGTIVDIQETYGFSGDDPTTEYTVLIDYTVDGKEYKNAEYFSYDSSMKVGGEVKVYYNPENPEEIQAEGFQSVPYVFLGVSAVCFIVGIFVFIRGKRV